MYFYIEDKYHSKPLPNLEKQMYNCKQLESAFIEICNKSKKNKIIECIYRHPSMDLCEFNNYFFNHFM